MVSIRDSLSELDKAYRLQAVLLECYRSTLHSMAQYAIEIDPEVTQVYRDHLEGLAGNLSDQTGPETFDDSRSVVRSVLREYRDRSAAALDRLRRELIDKAEALEAIVQAMASADGDHENRLKNSLQTLSRLSSTPEAAPLRARLEALRGEIEASILELKAQHQLVVSQFLVEIKTLHKRIERMEVASRKDVSGVGNRVEMETRIGAQVEQDKPFSLIFLRINNLPFLQREWGNTVRNDAVTAFAKRLAAAAPADAVVGRWSEDRFVAMVKAGKVEAINLAKRLTQHVAGVYVCLFEGKPQQPTLLVDSAVVDRVTGGTYESLMNRINHL